MDDLEIDAKKADVLNFLQQLSQCSVHRLETGQITSYQEFMCRLFYRSVVAQDASAPSGYTILDQELFELFLKAVEPTLDTLRVVQILEPVAQYIIKNKIFSPKQALGFATYVVLGGDEESAGYTLGQYYVPLI